MMFNRREKLMKPAILPMLYSVAVLAIGISTSTGQTNAPAPQNGPRPAPVNSVRGSTVRPNNSNPPYVSRGLANVSQRPPGALQNQIRNQPPTNFRANYRRSTPQLNPPLAAAGARQHPRTYDVQSSADVMPRAESAQTVLPTADPQQAIKSDAPQPTSEVPAKREISEGLETIDTQRVAKNDDVAMAPDLANGEVRKHKEKWNHKTGKNRFSYSDALRRNWHEWHDRDWWKQHCNTVVLVTGGYYFLDASYWYPAYGYDPLNSYYDYDGPIYTYGNLLPDQVIANVQTALQDTGYYFGPVTGSLSVDTRAALANFQRDQGLIVTGAIDEPTVEALGLY